MAEEVTGPQSFLFAFVAFATEQDFRDFADGFACALTARGQLDAVQARDRTANGTEEMRMSVRMAFPRSDFLETIDVIAQLGATK